MLHQEKNVVGVVVVVVGVVVVGVVNVLRLSRLLEASTTTASREVEF